MQESEYPNALRPGTVLRGNGTYTIERVLGAGGFGITYLAYTTLHYGNISTEIRVAIKEHFMSDHCERQPGATNVIVAGTEKIHTMVANSRKDFLAEARRLSQLGAGHDNIVKVNEVFEANGTAYYVMEYLEGRSLQDYIKEHGPLDSDTIRGLVGPIVNAAAYLHANRFTHLDIKPANIMLTQSKSGIVRPVLIDFGLSKHYDEHGNATSTINTMGASDGFAPVEQYTGITTFSPTADVYALGATMLTCATGIRPTKSGDWPDGEPECTIQSLPLDSEIKAVMAKAMNFKSGGRYRDAGAMEAAMGGGGGDTYNMNFREKVVSGPASGPTEPIKPERKTKRTGIIIGAIAAAVIIAAIAIFALVGKGGHNDDNLLIAAVDTSATEEVTPIVEVVVADDVAQQNAEALAQQQAQAEAQRLEQQRLEQQRQDQERREQELREREEAERQRLERERLERERLEREQAAAQAAAQQAAQSRLRGYENGHEWVDLGLSVKWATCNVGASNPDDYGTYFAWGETAGKSSYTMDNSRTYNNGNTNNITPNSGMDAARTNWGGRWRMPTEREFRELVSNCTWTWTSQNGHNGMRVTGPNGQSIFLPAAGNRDGTDSRDVGSRGRYWSSTSYSSPSSAWDLYFSSGYKDVDWYNRNIGRSVRPVSE